MIRSIWVFLSGFAAALALGTAVRQDWVFFPVFFLASAGSLVVVLRGWLGTDEETCRHGNRIVDGTESFRRARLELVRKDGDA